MTTTFEAMCVCCDKPASDYGVDLVDLCTSCYDEGCTEDFPNCAFGC